LRVLVLIFVAKVCLAEPLSLPQALAETVARHPLLAAADGRISTAQGLLEQAALRPNPRLALQIENLRGGWQGPFQYARDTDNFVWLQQTIETAKKRQHRTELASVNRQVAESARLLLRQQLVARVKQAWWAAIGAERARRIYDETRRTFAQIVEYHQIRVREGAMAEADLIRVRLEAERFALAANNADLAAERAKITLLREMGRSEFGPVELADELEAPVTAPAADAEKALNERGELAVARRVIAAARANQQVQVAQARPNYDVLGGYKRTLAQDTALVGLQIDLPFNNRNQGNIAAAVAEIRVAENDLKAGEALVKAELQTAATEVRLRRKQVEETLGPLRRQAAETARIAEAAYREGGTDLLRLLDAQRLQLETQLVFVQALVEYRLAMVSLETAMGANQ
jgi:cobalt-zinc-cadmium efflux system outer membrane protein